MTLYAVDDVSDAYDVTRRFLFPFTLGRWLKLALVVLFIGGASAGFPAGFDTTVPVDQPTGPEFGAEPEFDAGPASGADIEQFLPLILTLAALVVVFVLAFVVIGSIMEFVFVASLTEGDVTVRRYVGRYWGKGLRLLGFRIVLGLLTAAIVAIPVVVASVVFFDPGLGIGGAAGALALLAPVLLFVVLVATLVSGFTTMFVVPVMLLEDRGVLSAWGRFWPTLRGQWKQYFAYVVLELVLSIAAGVVVAVVTALALAVLAIPFGMLGVLTVVVAGGFGDLSLAVVALLSIGAVVFTLLAFFVVLLVQVPVVTYFRYYALLVLGDTDESLDLVPERRRRVRGSGSSDDPASMGDHPAA
ncbi:DUF7544 domain-containing protein [Halococcus saccharolyticus]|uniref:Glycerophosphoryl diester phosphodiesterase membrane domain-containing protein n=1 Tax=Halococcus saccharolyticus DSM 5350 TaxID=1227455 RepID=M0MIA5_9EURY|nr:hypothetical protein [Halococcus saccharolyticus]EMA44170.1 hypothetical protein C449_11608 [Halococcus saccharolyticus DSM 5350]